MRSTYTVRTRIRGRFTRHTVHAQGTTQAPRARGGEQPLAVVVLVELEAQRGAELAEAVVVEGDGPVLPQEGGQVWHDALVVPRRQPVDGGLG